MGCGIRSSSEDVDGLGIRSSSEDVSRDEGVTARFRPHLGTVPQLRTRPTAVKDTSRLN